jgi:hypothetical protein
MTLACRRPRRLAPALILATLFCLAAGRPATAQWGMGGWGWGWGMRGGGFLSNAATLRNVNSRSSQAARYAYGQRGGLGPQTVAGNSYVNHTRDASFGERFSVSSRRTLGSEAARLPASAVAEAAGADERAPARRVRPLEEYFTASGTLAWPSGAPEDGPLGSQRAAADSAVTAVYREVKASGRAPVAIVSDARAALVTYGQSALDELRAQATPAVVDGFHRFLLGLYDSLGQAAVGPSARRD